MRKDSTKVLVTFGLAESRLLGELHERLVLPLVRRAAWRHGLSKEDAGDVVQEAFVLAMQKLHSYDEEENMVSEGMAAMALLRESVRRQGRS